MLISATNKRLKIIVSIRKTDKSQGYFHTDLNRYDICHF